jgi:hypothetical protein
MKPHSPEHASHVAQNVLGEPILSVERFATGAGNWVYDVGAVSGRQVVVRFMRAREEYEAGICWNQMLRPLGVPLPEMLASDSDRAGNGWFVLQRFPGADLGHAYATLTTPQKLSILDGVMTAQAIVQRSVRPSARFGYATSADHAPHASWSDSIAANLERTWQRILDIGAVDSNHVTRVQRLLPTFADYFATVRPVPFMDDTTTRNVIVHDGVLQGIVDVDSLCWGDPLLVAALTRMALLSMRCDTIYTDAWFERFDPTPELHRVFDFYTAIFAVNFLSEQGQQFNRNFPPPIDPAEVDKLVSILDALLQRIA